jgi:hypothetical protein
MSHFGLNYDDLFIQFSWLKFAAIGSIYTLFIFVTAYSNAGKIFSRESNTSRSKILMIHLSFLTVLLAIALAAARVYPSLPSALTSRLLSVRGGTRASEFGIFTFGVVLITAVIEVTCYRRLGAIDGGQPQ